MARFTDEELAMLTEDERRAMEELGEEYDEDNDQPPMDPDDDPEEYEGAEEESDEADPDPDDDAADPDADDAGEDPDKDEQAAADDGGKDDQAQDEGADGDADPDKAVESEQQTPLLDAEMPEGYEDRIKELEGKRETLDTDFDDGELTSQEYRQQLREIENEERELRDQAFKANIAQEMQENRQKTAWQNTVNSFLDENDVYKQSRALYRELNDTVIEIANSEEAAKMTGDQILAEAHKRVSSDPALAPVFERGQSKQDAGDDDKGKQEGKGKDGKKLERRNVPPTLANVPASDMTDAEEGGRFAKLDKMDGLELESELAKLSATNPKLVEDYLSR